METVDQQPVQAELPLAIVKGEALTQLPDDLYIPPDALEIFLESFEGPFDLLLWLIRRQNIDILEISVADVTRQYMAYVELMQDLRFELAAEYLVMAAMLTEIKSRMLLPRPEAIDEEEEDDPRLQLIRRLQEYERYKNAAERLRELPQLDRNLFQARIVQEQADSPKALADVSLDELIDALAGVLERAKTLTHHQIKRENLSVREKMSYLLSLVSSDRFASFDSLFVIEEGRLGVVVTFLALLELLKASLLVATQPQPFEPIYVKAAGA